MYKDVFEKDGFCKENSIAIILNFFDIVYSKKSLLKIKDYIELTSFFKMKKIDTLIYMPLYFFLSPKFLYTFIKKPNVFIFSKKKLKKEYEEKDKKALMIYSSAISIYNIKELWTHYFVFLINQKNVFVYDSFINQYHNDYRELKNFNHSSCEEYLNNNMIKFLVWRQK